MRRVIRVISMVALISAVFGAGVLVGTSHPTALAQGGATQPADTEQLFAPFWEAWNQVHRRYVDPLNDDTLMQGAIAGMVDAIGDRHTAYMDPKLFETLSNDLSGVFEGIGATVKKDTATGGMQIISTITGAPARLAGIHVGDIIVTVEGQDITGLSQTQILGKIRGPAGTPVRLGLIRKGEKKPVEITVIRAKIEVPTVESALYQGGIGYIKLAEFNDIATRDLTKALKALDANHLKGLIFDLRDDPGGYLQTAIEVASQFIKSGPVVIERGKAGTRDMVYRANGNALAPDVPMIVLINGASASASELVAGALHDRGRATLLGEQSFGKGSVQEWSSLSNGGGLRITIAHFFTPTNRVINEVGLTPDVIVPWDVDTHPDFDIQLYQAIWILRGEF